MYNTKTLKNHKYAQARVRLYDNGAVELYSYRALVIRINPEKWLECTGRYSRTTIKHIGWFMREYTIGSYHDAKAAFVEHYRLNLETGEIQYLE